MTAMIRTCFSAGLVAAVGSLAAAFAHADTIVIEAAQYLDVVQGRLVAPAVVVVEGEKIVAINPATRPANARTIDLGGQTVLKGRMDSHTHLNYDIVEGWEGAAVSWSADEAEIRAMLATSVETFNRGDLPGHLSIYDAAVTFMTKDGPRPGVAPIEAAFRQSYFRDGLPKQQLRFEQLAVRPLGGDQALATGRFVLAGVREPDQTGWFTLVCVRTGAGWRAVHDHSS